MPQQRDPIEAVIPPQPLEILDLGRHRDRLGLGASLGSPPAPLVVVEEAERAGENVQLGEQVAVVEVGTAMEDDHRRPVADLAMEQTPVAQRHAAFAGRRRIDDPLPSEAHDSTPDARVRGWRPRKEAEPATLPPYVRSGPGEQVPGGLAMSPREKRCRGPSCWYALTLPAAPPVPVRRRREAWQAAAPPVRGERMIRGPP